MPPFKHGPPVCCVTGPFTKDLRELVMLVREPDTELLGRLTLLQRDFNASQLRAVPCPS